MENSKINLKIQKDADVSSFSKMQKIKEIKGKIDKF